jgi:pimeloyl-ACP methyl ester carboxylesterase
MNRVPSRDRTPIAFDRRGDGPPVILVDGALCHREMGPSTSLAERLAGRFTVFTYDRRGRGESGDTAPYAVEREIEDIEILVKQASGAAFLYGVSSGAALALEAANRLPGIGKLVLYEAPFIVDGTRAPITKEYWARIGESVAAGHRGEALGLFLKAVGIPPVVLAMMRVTPVWSKLKATAHTLPYDGALVQDYQQGRPLPAGRWASVTIPTLVMDGGRSPAWMRNGSRALAGVLPSAQYRTLDGQTHTVKPEVHAPVLEEFYSAIHRR